MSEKQKKIDKALFERLVSVQCPMQDIATVMQLDMDTLHEWCMMTYHLPVQALIQKRATIHRETFEGLCKMFCEKQEIAQVLRVEDDTLEDWCRETYNMSFDEAYDKYSAAGRAALRRKQFRLAEKSSSMAIWLGKNYLGQREAIDSAEAASLNKLDAILAGLKSEAENDAYTLIEKDRDESEDEPNTIRLIEKK